MGRVRHTQDGSGRGESGRRGRGLCRVGRLALVAGGVALWAGPAARGEEGGAGALREGAAPANGHIIVSTRADGAIVLLDPRTFRETDRLLAPVGLHEIAAAPDGRRAVGSAYGSGPRHQTPDQRLLVINLPDLSPATDDVLSVGPLIDLGERNPRPNDVAFLSDSKRLYCTSEIARSILTIDLDAATAAASVPPPPAQVPVSTGGIVGSFPFGARAGHMLASSPDGARVYVPSVSDGSVAVLDMGTGVVIARVETAVGAEGVAAAPDGTSVWVACNRSNELFVIDTATNAVSASMSAPGFPFRVRFTPDSSRVLVSFPGDHLVRVYDAGSREVERTIRLEEGSTPTSIAPSPDGRYAAVTCSGIESVVVLDLERGEVVATTRVGVEADGLAWAPAPESGVASGE